MKHILLILGTLTLSLIAHAQVPNLLNYQGRVAVGAVNFDGSGQFKFALVNTDGSTTYWSNDGSSTAGSQPTAAVTLTVTKGLYSVQLGDTALTNMTAVPASVFNNPDVRLRVWFNDGTNSFQLLTPDQRLTATGYAMVAAGLSLGPTINANNGVITQNGAPLLHTFGSGNTFLGAYAGNFSSLAVENTGVGLGALGTNQSGAHNTALGYYALTSNTTGSNNIAIGWAAMNQNTTGSNNIVIGNAGSFGESGIIRIGTAGTHTDTYLTGVIHGDGSGLTGITATSLAANSVTGTQIASGAVGSTQLASGLTLGGITTIGAGIALPVTTSLSSGVIKQNGNSLIHTFGNNNFFAGIGAGNFTMTGDQNTANGTGALQLNSTGSFNTAIGGSSLGQNTTGSSNTSGGNGALASNTTGSANTALGAQSLTLNVSGFNNTAVGSAALRNTTGINNIALGASAGINLTTGSNNIAVGHLGVAGESNVIRIGTTQTDTYLTGVIHGDGSALTNISAANFSGSLAGEVTGTQSATAIAATTVTGKLLTNFSSTTGTITASDSILSAINKLNGNIASKASTASPTFTGTVTAPTFTGALTGNVTGNVSGSAATFSGPLAGDVIGSQGATVVGSVGGTTAANVASGAALSNGATSANTTSTLVRRDGSGGFSAGTIVVDGNIDLARNTGSAAGVINRKNLFGPPSSLLHTYGGTFLGIAAGNFTNTAGTNVAIGMSSLNSITTGSSNTAVGDYTLDSNTTGSWNTAVGWSALASATNGQGNVAIGYYAAAGISGIDFVAVGRSAMNGAGSGDGGRYNAALGAEALYSIAGGWRNTAVGYRSLYANTTGENNVAVGSGAGGSLTSGSNNTAVGISALLGNTTGAYNTAVGSTALGSNQAGSYLTAFGANALGTNTLGTDNTAFGALALQSNSSGSFNTGGGFQSLSTNNTGGSNTAYGYYSLQANVSGSQNTGIGFFSLGTNTTGTNNTAIGYAADVSSNNLSNATAIGNGAIANASNTIQLGNSSITSLRCQVGLTVVSDRNQKENFQPMDGADVLRKIRGIDVTSWNYIGQDATKFRHYGPMAQDFHAFFGHDNVGSIGDEVTINSSDMAGVMFCGIKELSKKNALEEKEIKNLHRENAALKKRVAELEARENARTQVARVNEERLARLEALMAALPKSNTPNVVAVPEAPPAK